MNNLDREPRGTIYVRTLNVFKGRYERFYKPSRRHLVIDLVLIALVIALLTSNLVLRSKTFPIESVEIKVVKRPVVEGETSEVIHLPDAKLVLEGDLAYYTDEGEQLGIGPWPPVVNSTTSAKVFVRLTADRQGVNNAQVKIGLANDVQWTGLTSVNLGNALVYDPTSSSVIWSIPELKNGQIAEANFDLELTPDNDDRGTKYEMVKSIYAFGIDVSTKNRVESSLSGLFSPIVQ